METISNPSPPPLSETSPTAVMPAAELATTLRTPPRVFLFEQILVDYQDYTFIRNDGTIDMSVLSALVRHFRMDLAEWQRKGYRGGACNTYAEVACEVLSKSTHDAYSMHLLTYWPVNPDARWKQAWHTAAGFPLKNGEWCIIDGSMEHLTYVQNPKIYGKHITMELATVPIHRKLSWSHEPTPIGRLCQFIHIPEAPKAKAADVP